MRLRVLKNGLSAARIRGLDDVAPGLRPTAGGMIRAVTIAALGVALWLGPAVPGGAQSTDEIVHSLRKEIEALKEGQASMRWEIQELRDALRARDQAQAPPSPQNIALSLDGAPMKGDAKARLVLVDFTDYQ